eukprot:1317557-Amorphochlora_amoeboformis.AAC.1
MQFQMIFVFRVPCIVTAYRVPWSGQMELDDKRGLTCCFNAAINACKSQGRISTCDHLLRTMKRLGNSLDNNTKTPTLKQAKSILDEWLLTRTRTPTRLWCVGVLDILTPKPDRIRYYTFHVGLCLSFELSLGLGSERNPRVEGIRITVTEGRIARITTYPCLAYALAWD